MKSLLKFTKYGPLGAWIVILLEFECDVARALERSGKAINIVFDRFLDTVLALAIDVRPSLQ